MANANASQPHHLQNCPLGVGAFRDFNRKEIADIFSSVSFQISTRMRILLEKKRALNAL